MRVYLRFNSFFLVLIPVITVLMIPLVKLESPATVNPSENNQNVPENSADPSTCYPCTL